MDNGLTFTFHTIHFGEFCHPTIHVSNVILFYVFEGHTRLTGTREVPPSNSVHSYITFGWITASSQFGLAEEPNKLLLVY
jgi:hypothetical protein